MKKQERVEIMTDCAEMLLYSRYDKTVISDEQVRQISKILFGE